jgi:twitching motility protein PilT
LSRSSAIANQIRQNQIGQIRDVMQTSRSIGMFTLEDHLRSLVERGLIDEDTAQAYAQDPKALAAMLGSQ